MATNEEYEARIKKMKWPQLRRLWEAIQNRDTPEWAPGKAFEYLVLRMFDMDGALVRWPYEVTLLEGDVVEQIDGSVRFDGLYSLLESKDEDSNIPIGPIAKMRNQLLRRPAGTVGFVFATRGFTPPATQLAYFAMPQAILLWKGHEVEHALNTKAICRHAETKFRQGVDEGIPDHDITNP
jgi:hypothetical protein